MELLRGSTTKPSDEVIHQYKQYFKSINLEQYGTGILLSSLNGGKKGADAFQSTSSDDWLGDFLSQKPASTLHINKDSVQKKLWNDLENEIKQYETQHPDIKGRYIVAINADAGEGQPAAAVADKSVVLELVGENNQAESDGVISNHPVQVFKNETLDVTALPGAGFSGVEALVAQFLEKNKGVFQFLTTTPASDK